MVDIERSQLHSVVRAETGGAFSAGRHRSHLRDSRFSVRNRVQGIRIGGHPKTGWLLMIRKCDPSRQYSTTSDRLRDGASAALTRCKIAVSLKVFEARDCGRLFIPLPSISAQTGGRRKSGAGARKVETADSHFRIGRQDAASQIAVHPKEGGRRRTGGLGPRSLLQFCSFPGGPAR